MHICMYIIHMHMHANRHIHIHNLYIQFWVLAPNSQSTNNHVSYSTLSGLWPQPSSWGLDIYKWIANSQSTILGLILGIRGLTTGYPHGSINDTEITTFPTLSPNTQNQTMHHQRFFLSLFGIFSSYETGFFFFCLRILVMHVSVVSVWPHSLHCKVVQINKSRSHESYLRVPGLLSIFVRYL